jgi:hypothetical protein
MYKKITHHIVEEHFDHPIAADLKSKIDKKSKAEPDNTGKVLDPIKTKPIKDPVTGKYTLHSTNQSNKKYDKKSKTWIEVYNISPSSQIEKDSIRYWSHLAWRIRNIVTSITSGSGDTDSLKTHLVADIDDITSIVSECYGKEAAAQFKTLLTGVALALADVFVKIKNDKDTTDAMKILADATKSLGDFLETANSKWPSTTVVDILTQVENSYIMQAISRMKKEWDAADSAADGAYNILVVKQDNGNCSFADIFSAGIIDCMETKIENEIYNVLDYMES